MICAEHISLRLGTKQVLKDVSLQIEKGQIVVLLGANGAGKSSLLRVLSGELPPDPSQPPARITYEGVPLADLSVKELARRRAFLHQESYLDFAFTVLEVVLLGRSPHMQGSETPLDYTIARKALAHLHLLDREADPYTRLSGGEKQRVQLARVLAQIGWEATTRGRCLFLDEPTNNLDLAHQETICATVRSLANSGAAACMVLHDLNQALRHSDKIYILNEGRIALQGAPLEIAHSPELDTCLGTQLRRINDPESDLPIITIA
jgi:iron complex transport system ATP-binding protein